MFFVSLSFFFFKQKTAYEMRISDWSSDVCSSDLIHATLAGVILALCIPLGDSNEGGWSPLLYLEEKMHPWVAYAVVPIFGFANAGVSLAGISPKDRKSVV